MSTALPVHVSLSGRRVVIFGGGAAGAHHVADCLAADAQVHLISPWACSELAALAAGRRISWSRRNHRPGDLAGAWLTFAVSPEQSVNVSVQREADHRHIFCVRDDIEPGSAGSPLIFRGTEVVIGVSGPADAAAAVEGRLESMLGSLLQPAGGPETVPAQRVPEARRAEPLTRHANAANAEAS